MAIKKTVTTVHGLVAPDAYHRVEGLRLEGKDEITFQVRSYTDPTGPFFSEIAVSSPYDLEGENPIKQAYVHLKGLPEFAAAEDC